jgi:histidine triad (HIT) family protein
MGGDCIFCRIVAGEIPANRVFEDDRVVAFRDVHRAAPVHVLVVPREHIGSLSELEARHEALAGHLLATVARIARDEGIGDRGYRTIVNTGEDGGQTVPHLHLHLLGGERLRQHLL